MQVVCARCSRSLDYSGECPSFCAYCGQALSQRHNTPSATETAATVAAGEAVQPMPLPAAIAGYRLVRPLGTGGMGAVYEAEEMATGRRVALKLIKPEYAGSPDAVERFRQEGRIAAMVTHPRCVFVLKVDEEAGRPYIVMELMPGETLKELIGRTGPLPSEEAIAKIMDVIEGLQAAHRLQVIHRDVKPSNCFLEGDGRVKVGDFGLAKSLVQDAHITRSGAFVGTPHFASVEQIRGEPIDGQTDVYSAAATLYYLLTGQPPFAGNDSAATLARIVSEPPRPLRTLRPDLAPALEAAVMRGLERDRARRWPDLESFRQALANLTPEPLTAEGQVRRVVAYAVDACLYGTVAMVPLVIAGEIARRFELSRQTLVLVADATVLLLYLLYFVLLEHYRGASIGKGLLGLRVCAPRSIDPPGWGRAAMRTLVFLALLHGGILLSADDVLVAIWVILGAGLILCTMRPRTGFRGLHEVVSDTCVVRWIEPQPLEETGSGWLVSVLHGRRMNQGPAPGAVLPPRLAGFAVRATLKWTPSDKVVLGEDASLGRRVFLWLRPASALALGAARRDVGRRTRLRWLGCGHHGDLQWDAILMPLGSPLPELVQGEGLRGRRAARRLLEELSAELAAAVADGTLPTSLAVAQVWAQPDGTAQLADLPLTASPAQEEPDAGDEQQRALHLLTRVAHLILTGQPLSGPVSARSLPLPAGAQVPSGRLFGAGPPYATVHEFQDALRQSGEW